VSKTLVTGGTGFLGSHLVKALTERGDGLRLLVRESSRLDAVSGIEFETALGDVMDQESLEGAMQGVRHVFHVAGIPSMRPSDRERVFDVNVSGTRHVLEAAERAGVERVVHTSSIAAIGPAERGQTADETQRFTGGRLGITYINSKHEAELEALRYAERGVPVVIANPTFVLGPDDPVGTSNRLVRRFLQRQIPTYVEGALNIVDVRDVAAGHLLVDEKGKVGERYILGGRNFTLDRLFADLARISGVRPPPLRVPGQIALTGVEIASRVGIPIPTTGDEVRSGLEWWTYTSAKAERELGYSARPHEETLEDTVRWQMDALGDRADPGRIYDLPLDVAGGALRLAGRLLGR
jgi:dihydroflavonol-4-reductase